MELVQIPAAGELAQVLGRVGALFALGMVSSALVSAWRKRRPDAAPTGKTPRMGRRMATLAAANLILTLGVVLGGLPHAVLLALIGGMALREVAAAANCPDARQGWLVVLPILAAPLGMQALVMALAVAMLAPLALALRQSPSPAAMGGMLALAAGIPAIGLPLGLLAATRMAPDGLALVAMLLVVPQMADGFALLGGLVFGRRRMAPVLSPRKTWEGTVIGILAAMGAALVLQSPIATLTPAEAALAGLVMAVAAVLGDLAASFVKRSLGIDDFSQALPGHGGMLDRLDSGVLAFPAGWIALTLLAAH